MTNDQIIIYQTADEETSIDVKISADTVWLNQAQILNYLNVTVR